MRWILSLILILGLASCVSRPDQKNKAGAACTVESACEESPKPKACKPEPVPTKSDIQLMQERINELSASNEVNVETIEVQHLLVSFGGAGTKAIRSKKEAEELAAKLFSEIKGGADFDGMVKQHTDDSHPGIYSMTMNRNNRNRTIYQRSGMVPAFGNVGWKLKVGEVGVAPFSSNESPYGWHIIKRTK